MEEAWAIVDADGFVEDLVTGSHADPNKAMQWAESKFPKKVAWGCDIGEFLGHRQHEMQMAANEEAEKPRIVLQKINLPPIASFGGDRWKKKSDLEEAVPLELAYKALALSAERAAWKGFLGRQQEITAAYEAHRSAKTDAAKKRHEELASIYRQIHFGWDSAEAMVSKGAILSQNAKLDKSIEPEEGIETYYGGAIPPTLSRGVQLIPADYAIYGTPSANKLNKLVRDPSLPMTTLCPNASPGCKSQCLSTSGQNSMHLRRMLWRVQALYKQPQYFWRMFAAAVDQMHIDAKQNDPQLKVAMRFNVLSDIPIETYLPQMATWWPDMPWYDYTKVGGRETKSFVSGGIPYDLTYSFSGANVAKCEKALAQGRNVAVVYLVPRIAIKVRQDEIAMAALERVQKSIEKAKADGDRAAVRRLMKEAREITPNRIHRTVNGKVVEVVFDVTKLKFMGHRVIDGDIHDIRFYDPKGVVVGLTYKPARRNDPQDEWWHFVLPTWFDRESGLIVAAQTPGQTVQSPRQGYEALEMRYLGDPKDPQATSEEATMQRWLGFEPVTQEYKDKRDAARKRVVRKQRRWLEARSAAAARDRKVALAKAAAPKATEEPNYEQGDEKEGALWPFRRCSSGEGPFSATRQRRFSGCRRCSRSAVRSRGARPTARWPRVSATALVASYRSSSRASASRETSSSASRQRASRPSTGSTTSSSTATPTSSTARCASTRASATPRNSSRRATPSSPRSRQRARSSW